MIELKELKVGDKIQIDDTGNFKGVLSGIIGTVTRKNTDGSFEVDYQHGQLEIDSVENINGIKQYYYSSDRR